MSSAHPSQGSPHRAAPKIAGPIRPDDDESVMIGRQPIFDEKSAVYGYELLFRSCSENRYVFADPRMASAHTMDRALSIFGLGSLVGTRKAFINFTLELIMEEMYAALPKDRCVIEVLETTLA